MTAPSRDDDRLNAARGVVIGLLLGVLLWSPVIYLVWKITQK